MRYGLQRRATLTNISVHTYSVQSQKTSYQPKKKKPFWKPSKKRNIVTCPLHRLFQNWRMKGHILHPNRAFTVFYVKKICSITAEGVKDLRKEYLKVMSQRPPIKCGHGISHG